VSRPGDLALIFASMTQAGAGAVLVRRDEMDDSEILCRTIAMRTRRHAGRGEAASCVQPSLIRGGRSASPEGTMQTFQDRLTLLLRAYRTIRFCDACLALKMGAFPREVREAVVLIADGVQVSSGQCSECLQEKTVVRTLAA
jgi:hypothetical protein